MPGFSPFLFLALAALYVGVAWALGAWARAKGYPFAPGFFASLAASPLTVWLVLMFLPDRGPREDPRLGLEIEMEKARMAAAAREAGR
jgi:hypothetical protein